MPSMHQVFINNRPLALSVHATVLAGLLVFSIIYGVQGDIEPQPSYDDAMEAAVIPNGAKHQPQQQQPPHHQQSSTDDSHTKSPTNTFANLGFIHGFVASLSVIVVSELGDKTFFIAAIMAMRHRRAIVFGGAIAALALMTILSAVFGMAATIIPRVYTYYISTALFAIFGLKMLRDGYHMNPADAQEELEEVQSDLKKREDEYEKVAMTTVIQDPESGLLHKKSRSTVGFLRSRILMQAFTMTFLAEWGDRSQLTTIILGAREDVYGVIVGGILGHSLCTGLAVIGGRMIAQRISVRTVTLIGGVVFLLFAFSALYFSPNEEVSENLSNP